MNTNDPAEQLAEVVKRALKRLRDRRLGPMQIDEAVTALEDALDAYDRAAAAPPPPSAPAGEYLEAKVPRPTFCPEDGRDVPIDEDGCCALCGATATGAAVDAGLAPPAGGDATATATLVTIAAALGIRSPYTAEPVSGVDLAAAWQGMPALAPGTARRGGALMGGECHFCERPTDDGDFCHGCLAYVCEDCDETQPAGAHGVEDHRTPTEAA